MRPLSPILAERATQNLARLEAVTSLSHLDALQRQQLQTLLALSDFIAATLIQYPEALNPLLEELQQDHSDYVALLAVELAEVHSEEQLKHRLRRFRRVQQLSIAGRELLGWSPVEESFKRLSALAEGLILAARDWLYRDLSNSHGVPTSRNGEAQPLLILGMGKLGGGELNFSSDIDLIFTFPEHGETQGGRRQLDNQAFFIKLGQRLIQVLHQPTVDGQVYRVDMRLRPFGDAGPLAISFAALEEYYQNHGRNWERYAMVKARALGAECTESMALQKLLTPFVYRRYLDFSAIDGLRQMKALIEAEVRRRNLLNHLKLGAGGIRELEFTAQVLQLIRGGRDPSLRKRHLPDALNALSECGVLPSERINALQECYRQLRRVENWLQEFNDEQTQSLPDDPLGQARLLYLSECSDWTEFLAHLEPVRASVRQEFNAVVGEVDESQSEVDSRYQELWLGGYAAKELAELWDGASADDLAHELLVFKGAAQKRQMGPQGRAALDSLMPPLLASIAKNPAPLRLLQRSVAVLSAILTRSTYLQLLAENRIALEQLLHLLSASQLVAEQLARHPLLLDELLTPQSLYRPTPLDEYRTTLQQFMLRIPNEDSEAQLEALRQFKQIQLLRIVAADIAGNLPLMRVSDHLTRLAEALVEMVVNLAWEQVSQRHGVPACMSERGERGFAAIAYGKLGGLELGYGSDLDLVFLYRGDPDQLTDGAKPIDTRQFYLKLVQRIIQIFSSRTLSGTLYEIDLRLRPAGAAGLMVSSLDAFADYQQQEAWIWEHQALVRSRVIYGDRDLAHDFNALRAKILSLPRSETELKEAVTSMRTKMRQSLNKSPANLLDPKQMTGGMIDIEFLAQYLVLAHSAQHPSLTEWSDNMRIFDRAVALGVLSPEFARALQTAYLAIRDRIHRLTLNGESILLVADELQIEREQVIEIWQAILGGDQ